MMNIVKKAACALVVLATTSSVVMAVSIDVKVIGTITPAACKPTLSGGGVIDYGKIQIAALKRDELNQLAAKQLDFAITCDSPAQVALTGINGRPGTAAGTASEQSGGSTKAPDGINTTYGDYVVGLGQDGNKKIGGYTISISNILADNVEVDGIYKANTLSWRQWKGIAVYGGDKLLGSVAKKGELQPISFTTLSGKLNVQAYLNKISDLDITKPIKLDGLTTLELVYL
ncbi:DUF1120 domain-containing protein [Klebsiella sp. BIGb0407]|uniref:DUF1120 domain-containing protein n=1 Tax=Klebsiella sp. BIGb0407 TaxID=2940603 RepID=UPI0021687F59|nr:DUF1120 domain-containing protein [Klebsiella sp. BIGb0407]MCS3432612.1 hypothetical protein [Klebsiella sp. BIGb0407]